jgi:hypothetical protein
MTTFSTTNLSLSNLIAMTGVDTVLPLSASNLYTATNVSSFPTQGQALKLGHFRGVSIVAASGVAKSVMYPPSAVTPSSTTVTQGSTQYTFTTQGGYNNSGWTFDKDVNTGTYYTYLGKYNASSGVYEGTAGSTNGITGAWQQVYMNPGVVINGYDLTQHVSVHNFKKWYLFGSTDGINWVQLHMVSLASWHHTDMPTRFSFNNITSYSYYRFVINLGMTADPYLVDLAFVYTSDSTDAIISLKSNSINGGSTTAAVSSWGVFAQTTAAKQPVWNAKGGYYNSRYMYFAATPITMYNTSPISFPVATNGGLTFAVMYNVTDTATPSTDWARIFGTYQTSNQEGFVVCRFGSNNDICIQLKNSSFAHVVGSGRVLTGMWNTGWKVIIFRHRTSDKNTSIWTSTNLGSTTMTQSVNATETVTATDMTINNSLAWIGSDNGINQYPWMQLGGMLLFNRAISDGEKDDIYSYFRSGGATVNLSA